ncbi:MAG: ribokinase [Alphaproteobacteria bacterium]|nr:ribokinase [Alphaproteobacteria bacterium]
MNALPDIAGRVLVAGDIMTDIVVKAEGPAVRGSDRRAAISIVEGGSAANQAAWLAACGVPVALFARVGSKDRDAIAARLRAEGVEPLLSDDPVRHSGRLVTLLDPSGERSFFADRGANLGLSYADLSPHWRANTGLVVLSGYSFFAPEPRACVLKMIEAARQRRLPVVVDAASAGFLAESGGRSFLEWTQGATLVVANADEAALITGMTDPAAQLAALAQSYPAAVVKSGAEGSHAVVGGEAPVFVAGTAREAIDTTGAGDAFLAGFISAWREKKPLAQCLHAGNRLGALAIERIGGRPEPGLAF